MITKDQANLAVKNNQYYKGSQLINIRKDQNILITDFNLPKIIENKYEEILKVPELKNLVINTDFCIMSMKNFLCSYILYGEINGFNCSIYICKGIPIINFLNGIDFPIYFHQENPHLGISNQFPKTVIYNMLFVNNAETIIARMNSNFIFSGMSLNPRSYNLEFTVFYIDKQKQYLYHTNLKQLKKLKKEIDENIYERICTMFEEQILKEL